MRLVVLTTETKHHIYFLNRLAREFEIVGVFYERRRLEKPYPTGPFFDDEEDRYEERFFDRSAGGTERKLSTELARRVVEIHDVNQTGVAEHMDALEPSLGVLYGVGLVKPHVFQVPSWGCINVHRGIPERYRGLDSDLWAIYEGEFDRIGAAIHYVDEELDTGDILAQDTTPIGPEDEIYHLRYKTSVLATDMMIDVLGRFAEAGGPIEGRPQPSPGPYYTAMPLDKKREALTRFAAHKRRLASEVEVREES